MKLLDKDAYIVELLDPPLVEFLDKDSSFGKLLDRKLSFVELLDRNPYLVDLLDKDPDLVKILDKDRYCSVSRWRPQKVDKRMVLEYTHGLFIT